MMLIFQTLQEDEEDAQSPWPAIVNSMHRPEPTGYRIRKSSKWKLSLINWYFIFHSRVLY